MAYAGFWGTVKVYEPALSLEVVDSVFPTMSLITTYAPGMGRPVSLSVMVPWTRTLVSAPRPGMARPPHNRLARIMSQAHRCRSLPAVDRRLTSRS